MATSKHGEVEQAVLGWRAASMGRWGLELHSEAGKGPWEQSRAFPGHLHRPLVAQGWVCILS